jgi:hypothetical protein
MRHRPSAGRLTDHMCAFPPDSGHALAYETQARYAPGEPWVTLDVSICLRLAVEEAFFRRDPWGRVPTEVRVRRIGNREQRAA